VVSVENQVAIFAQEAVDGVEERACDLHDPCAVPVPSREVVVACAR